MTSKHDAFSRAEVGPIQINQLGANLMDSSRNTFQYSNELSEAAEKYMIELFEKGGVTTRGAGIGESSYEHTIMLINVAMHIISKNNWIQVQPQDVTMNIIDSGAYDEEVSDDDNFNDDDGKK